MRRKHKYGAKAVEINGMRFPSQHEANRWAELAFREKAGEIQNLKRQVDIYLMGANGPILTPTGRKAKYVADFRYWDVKRGREIIEDAKGFQTPEYKLKRAILAAQGVEIEEV